MGPLHLAAKSAPDLLSIITSVTVIAAVIGGVVTLVFALIGNRVATHKDQVQLYRQLATDTLTEMRSILTAFDELTIPTFADGSDDFAKYHNAILPTLRGLSLRLRNVAMLP